ncbi:MAG: dihydroneopterin aldolase [Pseudomonadota bacterium]
MTSSLPSIDTTGQVVSLRDFTVEIPVGIVDWERAPGKTQKVVLNVDLYTNYPESRPASIGDCLDYRRVIDHVDETWRPDRHVDLLETLAFDLIAYCLEDPRVEAVRVALSKPHVFNGRVVPTVTFFQRRGEGAGGQ